MDDREYRAGAAAAASKPAVRRSGRSALLRTAVIAATVASLGLTPAVAGAGETAARSALEADRGIQGYFRTFEACDAEKNLFRHYGLLTSDCIQDPSNEPPNYLWYFTWWTP